MSRNALARERAVFMEVEKKMIKEVISADKLGELF